MPITASIPFPPLSPEQHLQKALESLTQAYKGLKEEEEKKRSSQTARGLYTEYSSRGESLYKRKRKAGKKCPKRTSRRSKSPP